MSEVEVKWVHCSSHGAVHPVHLDGTCWCESVPDHTPQEGFGVTLLRTIGEGQEARRLALLEARDRALWLFKPA